MTWKPMKWFEQIIIKATNMIVVNRIILNLQAHLKIGCSLAFQSINVFEASSPLIRPLTT